MRITIVMGFFLPVPPVAGGAMEKMWWRLGRAYARRGHEVTIISRRWPGSPRTEAVDGVRLIRIDGWDQRRRLWQNLVLDAFWGWRVLRRLPPGDILVTNTVALPVFIRRLRPDAGLLVINLNRFPKGQVRWYGGAARVQAASEAIAAAVRVQAPARAPVVRVVPNPVDCATFAPPAVRTARRGPFTIGYLGRLHPEKGLATLVAAAGGLAARPDLPPWRIVLRGPADVSRGGGGEGFVETLRAAAPALWAEGRISIHPPLLDPAELAGAYHGLDAFCYPTVAERGEAQPIAVLEAMAAARPIVATDLACFADHLRPGVTALLVPPGDAGALADALVRLIGDAELGRRLGAAALQRVQALDDARIVDQHLADYEALLDAASR